MDEDDAFVLSVMLITMGAPLPVSADEVRSAVIELAGKVAERL